MNKEKRAIEGSLTFTLNELKFLFLLIDVGKLPGISGENFSDTFEPNNNHLWQETTDVLLNAEWLSQDTNGNFNINSNLIQVLLNMAYANKTIVSNWKSNSGNTSGITHYIGKDFTVEMVNQGSNYLLTFLESIDIALNRIGNYLNLPKDSIKQYSVILTKQESELLKSENPVVKNNIPKESLNSSLQSAIKRGTFTILRKNETGYQSEIVGFVTSPTFSWLIFYQSSSEIIYRSINLLGFIEIMDKSLNR